MDILLVANMTDGVTACENTVNQKLSKLIVKAGNEVVIGIGSGYKDTRNSLS